MEEWYQNAGTEVLDGLRSRPEGLTEDEVAVRRREHGPNELVERDRRGPWQIIREQFQEPMVWLLIVAGGVSLFIGEYLDAGAIATIVVLNVILGFVQDYRAEKAMAALRELAVPEVQVRRGGTQSTVSADQLVPGDVVLLQAGNRVPADGRLLDSRQLQIQEAALTGESEAVVKQTEPLKDSELALGDRTNMVFMGTDIASGRGEAVVTAIGMQTELGKIADMIQGVATGRTPLQRRLARMGIWLAVAALGIIAVVVALGVLRGQDLSLLLMTALSMAVAAVPEGLPAVATIALALGAKRMLRRHALIRKLPAVETLGSVTVICSDKTGTLTQNRMQLRTLCVGDFECDVQSYLDEHADAPAVDAARQHEAFLQDHPTTALLLLTGALCNDAVMKPRKPAKGNDVSDLEAEGDPTEGALLIAAEHFGLHQSTLRAAFPRVDEVPFDSQRKRMTTIHEIRSGEPMEPIVAAAMTCADGNGSGSYFALLKGAADAVLDVCNQVCTDDGCRGLDDSLRDRLYKTNDDLAAHGNRVLGFAFRRLDAAPVDDSPASVEKEFVFLGLAGLIDPPREEALDAVQRCQTAGIRAVMITGDHPLTAEHIATDVGINHHHDALTGRDLDRLSNDELEKVVDEISVYARVSPEHKLRIVESLQRRGHIVAMTGDGVNDAPALKTADIGVAMGITGTDVSKDASDTVLLDDNFATIINSVEEGRIIYDNIRKFLQYTMTSNTGEILVMLAAPLFGMPLPLVPLQILWINLVTDGLPGLAMAVEQGESNIMRRAPRDPDEPIFDREMILQIIFVGTLMGAVSLGAGYWYWIANPTRDYNASWGTIVFTVLTLSQMGNALAIRSHHDSLFRIGVFSNPAMIGSVLLTLLLQLAIIYVPFFQELFGTVALSMKDLAICLATSTVIFWAVEAQKWWRRRSDR